jgi:Terpene cyclase DEP1
MRISVSGKAADWEGDVGGKLYWTIIAVLGVAFAVAFGYIVGPPLLTSRGDVVGGLLAGFANPYASGYALDAIFCWLILSAWILHERATLNVKHGWIAIILGAVPGVATGFALYLFLRARPRAA